MKVIVDNKIPYIREALSRLADEVIYLPGHDFTPDIVKDADALIIVQEPLQPAAAGRQPGTVHRYGNHRFRPY